jgi:hypothetical protein
VSAVVQQPVLEQHAQDADCLQFLDEERNCTVCGVGHGGDACAECGGRGFHDDECEAE